MRLSKYPDVRSVKNTDTVVLERDGRSIELTVEALPPDYQKEVEGEIPSPTPPRLGIEKDKAGKPVMDPDTGRPVPRYNEDDPDYRAEVREANTLQMAKFAIDGLASDEVEFEASKNGDNPKAFYRDVLEEMKQFGFSFGDLVKLAMAAQRVSGISPKELEAATEGFFSTET